VPSFKSFGLAYFGVVVAALSQLGNAQVLRRIEPSSSPSEYRQIRALIAHWNASYRRMEARTLAALETVDVEIIDRFGELHRPLDVSERERFWSEGFEQIERENFGPEFTIKEIRLIRPDTGVVQVCAYYGDGIRLADGGHIPPLWEFSSYLVVKTRSVWLVAALDIHDQITPEGCAGGR
jgi:hypothetical protein